MRFSSKTQNQLCLCLLASVVISLTGLAFFQQPGVLPVQGVPTPMAFPESRVLPPVPLFRYVPVIDPGHGGVDGGAVSPISGKKESEYNLDIGLKSEVILRFLGFKPILTRESDVSLYDFGISGISKKKSSDLRARARLVNGIEGAVLISIHQNTFPDPKYGGVQVFHNGRDNNQSFAELMQNRLNREFQGKRKAKKTEVYLLKKALCPSILVECGFLTNAADEALLRNDGYQKRFAVTMCAALLEWDTPPVASRTI
ncbi:MAG: N-acetylmuramoyl-L-alanine amidase [Oscillospiraceae bacterium]|nr:N-acetylmuramoyl-L-alanine amidase [Oscillospiraceae bacterium]